MGSADIKSMDLRLGGNPFPTAQQRLQEATTSFSLPIPSPSKMNRPSQPQPYQFPSSHPTLKGSNITKFDLAANAALQAANLPRASLGTGTSPLKRSLSYAAPSSTPIQPQPSQPVSSKNFAFNSSPTLTQFHLSSPSYPLAPLPENIDHARAQADKRDLKGPKRASLQPPAPIQRSYSQPAYSLQKDASMQSPTTDSDGQYEFEPLMDDGTKPPYSYAHLIGMAILRSPQRRLTLNQIYTWITTTFEYYRAEAQPQTNWQNSIRHNLSLNKAFIKEERPKDEPGKGHYWKIVPGAEAQFAKGAKGRRPLVHRSATMNMPPPMASQAQMASVAALSYHSLSATDDIQLTPAAEQTGRQRADSISSNEGPRSRKNSNSSKLPVFEFEIPKPATSAPRHQPSPVLPPSMDTPPPSQDNKRKRTVVYYDQAGHQDENQEISVETDPSKNAFDEDDAALITLHHSENSNNTFKRPRLDSTLSQSRIIAKPPPPSFHNLSIISPPPSSSPQRAPLSSNRKVVFTTPRAQITRRLEEAPPSTCSPQTRLQLHREDINRYLSSPAKSVIFESSFDDPYLDFENSPGKQISFNDGQDDVVLRYAYGSPAKRATKRRNYWRRLHSGFDPADIDGEAEGDATEVYGVDLGYICRATMQKDPPPELDKPVAAEDEEDEEADGDYQEDNATDATETDESSSESGDDDDLVASLEWSQEHEEVFGELSPP